MATFVGPVHDKAKREEVFLCAYCDAEDPRVVAELGQAIPFPWRVLETDCVLEYLADEVLVGDQVDCLCFAKSCDELGLAPNEARYFHYRGIAKLLGAKGQGKRVKLPACVVKRVASVYPDADGAATKVGFRAHA